MKKVSRKRSKFTRAVAAVFILVAASLCHCTAEEPKILKKGKDGPKILEKVDVDKVWSGHPVGFCLLTHGDHQFVAYYNAKREMTIASRKLGEKKWTRQRLPSNIKWDSHNYITMALDKDKCLHVSGNMHASPLVYFRSEKPLDVTSLKPIHRMTGKKEKGVTYPRFMRDNKDRLLFMYRNGGSGNGERLVNIYDNKKHSWKRLIETPLLNGRVRKMNAYPVGPFKGPDGLFHLMWMWRNTPDAGSNHDISYARSRDLVHWKTVDGKPVPLPITPDNKDVIVDPIPPFKGLINMGHSLSFDNKGRPVVSYHKYDAKGLSQIYLARWEKNAWKIRQVSSWDTRWEFGGGGCISCEVSAGPLVTLPDGRLVQSWRQKKYGKGTWQLDPKTLKVIGSVSLPPKLPKHLQKPESDIKGMMVRWRNDSGDKDPSGAKYCLRWETLPVNRDKARKGPLPKPTMLRVYKFKNK